MEACSSSVYRSGLTGNVVCSAVESFEQVVELHAFAAAFPSVCVKWVSSSSCSRARAHASTHTRTHAARAVYGQISIVSWDSA